MNPFHQPTPEENFASVMFLFLGGPFVVLIYYLFFRAARSVARGLRDNTPGPVKEVAVNGAASLLGSVIKGLMK
jgi:hypothetical protein